MRGIKRIPYNRHSPLEFLDIVDSSWAQERPIPGIHTGAEGAGLAAAAMVVLVSRRGRTQCWRHIVRRGHSRKKGRKKEGRVGFVCVLNAGLSYSFPIWNASIFGIPRIQLRQRNSQKLSFRTDVSLFFLSVFIFLFRMLLRKFARCTSKA